MNTKEAKDFLAKQAAEQAALAGVSLSDLEVRMLYFAESDPPTCPEPVGLNEEFESKFETPYYEAKMWGLLHDAWKRVKKQKDSVAIQTWRQAIRTLRQGDHYLLVLWDFQPQGERPKYDSLKLWASGIAIVGGVLTAAFFSAKYNLGWGRYGKSVTAGVVVLIVARRGLFRILRRRFGSP